MLRLIRESVGIGTFFLGVAVGIVAFFVGLPFIPLYRLWEAYAK